MIRKYLLLLTTMTLSFLLRGQAKDGINDLNVSGDKMTQEQLNLIFEKTKNFPNETELAIAMVNEGEVIYYGVKRTDDKLYVVENTQSIFEIASISKVFTATLLANFVVENKLSIDAPIQDYCSQEIKTQEKITFKELANHTSGLYRMPANISLMSTDPNNPYKNYGKEELQELLVQYFQTRQAHGTKYEYSNLGAGLLGYLLAEYEHTTYEALLQEYIFSKYKMNHSTTDRTLVKDKLVDGLNYKGDKVSNWDFNILAGAGGILSNVEDLTKFAVAQFNADNEALTLTRQSTFFISDQMDVALGWHIIKTKSGAALHWHNGGSGGYSSSMVVDVKDENAVIILSNVSAYNQKMGNIDELVFGLRKLLE